LKLKSKLKYLKR